MTTANSGEIESLLKLMQPRPIDTSHLTIERGPSPNPRVISEPLSHTLTAKVEDKQAKLKKILDEINKPELKPYISKEEVQELNHAATVADTTNPNPLEVKKSLKLMKKLAKAANERQDQRKYGIERLKNLLTALQALNSQFDRKRYKYIKPAVKSCLKTQWENTNSWFQRKSPERIEGNKTKDELEEAVGEYDVMAQQLYTLYDMAVKNLDSEMTVDMVGGDRSDLAAAAVVARVAVQVVTAAVSLRFIANVSLLWSNHVPNDIRAESFG
ncbi:unnamed protein product [Calicophoron daubneyi]|uniref:Uncharacterized protein n=1 Tax=Calicophoron daubneyi TaxID=300641 RepID=A0AAV2TPR4_CALDB